MKKLYKQNSLKKTFLLMALLYGLFGTPKSFGQATPLIGQIAAVGFNFAPQGWEKCEGQLLPIAQYSTLFSLIGTYYGGDGITTFALPDYRGRTLVGVGQGPGLTNRVLGQAGGATSATLTVANLPAHTHTIAANTGAGTTNDPTNNVYANTGLLDKEYSNIGTTVMSTTGSTGNNNPLSIEQPYLGIYYIIATEGIYPARN
jgi:microcystin-dependent protein